MRYVGIDLHKRFLDRCPHSHNRREHRLASQQWMDEAPNVSDKGLGSRA